MNTWDKLTQFEKAEVMKIALDNGIYNLDTIRNAYNEYAQGGSIHIDPSKRGTFTAAASKHNMGVQEFASKVLANKEDYSPAMVKKANFARNASKWHSYGGNLYDGTTENSQQMQQGYIRQRPEGSYFYDVQGQPTIDVTPLNTSLSDNPADWTFTDASGKIYNPHREAVKGTGKLSEAVKEGPLVSAANNYFRELNWRIQNDPSSIALKGKYTMPLILSPLLGQGAATALTNPYVDAALTSGFAAHGLNHWLNEGIDGWGDAAMTALEVTPLGRLARPMWNAGKEGLQYTAKVADNTARYISPSYDLYRTIGETTPRTTPTYHGFRLNGEQVYTGSPLFEFGQTMRTSPEEAYFMRAPKDVDVLKLGNGEFRHEVIGNEILPSGEVNGKFVSYGEPWQEFALGENSALYEFPVGPRRGPSLMATDWKGRPQKYSVDEVYDYMQQEEALRKELASIEETMGDDFLKQYSTIRRNLINEKYPALKEHIDTSIYGANQTVIPNERWSFDKFLKTPFWKYSENPTSGQVQKELMMRWPEAKSLETPAIEWADATRAPQITAENAAIITPEQWTAAQDAAIARGDMAEAQRLRDLHFKVSAPDTKVVDINGNPQLVIHKTPNDFTVFDNSRSIGNLNWTATPKAFEGENGVFATGAGTNPKEMRLYVNMKNPHYPTIEEGMEPAFINEGEDGILGIADKDMTDFYKSALDAGEGFNMSLGVDNPYALKSANAVTYDDNGIRIPLGSRDNFNLNDIRYGLLPIGIGLTGYGLSQKRLGGRIRFEMGGPIRKPMPPHPKKEHREKDTAAYAAYEEWQKDMEQRSRQKEIEAREASKKRAERNKQAADELNRKSSVVMSALESQTNSVPFSGKEMHEAVEKQREDKLNTWRPIINMADIATNAAGIMSGNPWILGAAATPDIIQTVDNAANKGITGKDLLSLGFDALGILGATNLLKPLKYTYRQRTTNRFGLPIERDAEILYGKYLDGLGDYGGKLWSLKDGADDAIDLWDTGKRITPDTQFYFEPFKKRYGGRIRLADGG